MLEAPAAAAPSTPEVPNGSRPIPPQDGLLAAIEPQVDAARARVLAGIAALGVPALDACAVEALLFAPARDQLLALLRPTLALELHVARLEGHLGGASSEARFRSFVDRLRRPDARDALFAEYPVLATEIAGLLERWAAASLEFAARLAADLPAILDAFAGGVDPGPVVAIRSSGDTHRGGRSVSVVTFASGLRVVYKPRPLAVERHFQELLAWLGDRLDAGAADLRVRTLRVLDRGDWGWVEFAAAAPCASREELRRFYRRHGATLAILYALEATDFHYENLVAAGEHPVLIDLEALFHPHWGEPEAEGAEDRAGRSLGYSVLRVGLLPQRWSTGDESVELSGLGGRPGQLTPRAVPRWQDVGTDQMRVQRIRIPMEGADNRPTLDGREVDPVDHTEDVVAGFRAMARLLVAERASLLAPGGPIARFADDVVRVIFRMTAEYAFLLRESFHPDLLRSADERDRFLDKLARGVTFRPALAALLPSERAALRRGDVPLFTTRVASRHVWSDVGERLPDFLDESGLDAVGRRLRALDDGEIDRQIWFIRASLASLASPAATRGALAANRSSPAVAPADSGRLLAAACAAGDRLAALAWQAEGQASWLGLGAGRGGDWAIAPVESDLYSGSTGIALFLGYLAEVTGEARHAALARAALAPLCRQIEDGRMPAQIAGFVGQAGLIYALSHLGRLWRDDVWLDHAETLAAAVARQAPGDVDLDVTYGVAGSIGALRSLLACRPSDATRDAIRACADRLVSQARPAGAGLAWTPAATRQPLAGFAHGAAGISWALLEAWGVTGEERFREVARRGHDFERGLYDRERANWPDVSEDAAEARFAVTWCYGAAGIGLGRLAGLRHDDDPAARADVDAAVATTLREGFGGTHSLCHGDIGNLELVLAASRDRGDPDLARQTYLHAASILDEVAHVGWLCGVPLAVETPGLMMGIAGIGYGLLRLAAPDRVPSVLVLEPPPGTVA